MASTDKYEPVESETAEPSVCCTPRCKVCWAICGCCSVCTAVPLIVILICFLSVQSDTTPIAEALGHPVYPVTEYPGFDEAVEVWVADRSEFPNTTSGDYAKFGFTDWSEAPLIMYNATKIPGNWEQVPQKLRGVYWMHGNGMPEVLASIQFSQWWEDEKVLIVPVAPYNWGWYGGPNGTAPSKATANGAVYMQLGGWWQANSFGTAANVSTSFAFGPCPTNHKCEEGSDDFTYASLQSHPGDDLNEVSALTRANTWTMEEVVDGPEPGSHYWRGNYWACGKIGFGSYDLRKVVNADGEKLEPHWTMYKDYMEGHPLILQTGWLGGP